MLARSTSARPRPSAPRQSRGLPLVCVALASCFSASRDPELVARIDALEKQVAEQDRQLAKSRAQPGSTELALIAGRLEEVLARLAALDDAPPRAPRPPANRRAPDPAATYAVPVGGSPVLGPDRAKVTIVMAFEFACAYCRKAWDTMDDLRKRYGNDLRVVYKQYIVHPAHATPAAQASCAAHQQGRWREHAELVWRRMFEPRHFDPATLEGIAVDMGLDMQRYRTDTTGRCVQDVKDEHALLHRFAVSGTPAFFINGRFMSGARDIAEFARLVDEELAKAAATIKRGVKPDRFYDAEIVGKGVTEVPSP
jgi:protein-disulfide isomerase